MGMKSEKERALSLMGEESGIDIYEKWIIEPLPEVAIALAYWEGMGSSTETVLVLRRVWEAKLAEENAKLIKEQTKITFWATLIAAGIGATATVVVGIIAKIIFVLLV